MRPTIEYIERKFDEFNRLMFAGRLPRLPVRLSDAKTFLGACCSKVRRLPDGRGQHYDFELRINTRVDLPERVVEDTVIHEMIHYFILYNGLADTSPHGQIFTSLMRSLNATFGRNVAVSHKYDDAQSQQAAGQHPVWHVVAAVRFRSGRSGVKVLPRVAPKIVDYHTRVLASPEVEDVTLVLTNNPFFNRYPTSAALRVHDIDPRLLAENLRGGQLIRVDGPRLVPTKTKI